MTSSIASMRRSIAQVMPQPTLTPVPPQGGLAFLPPASPSTTAVQKRGVGSVLSVNTVGTSGTHSAGLGGFGGDLDLPTAVKRLKAHQNQLAKRVVDDLEVVVAAQHEALAEALAEMMAAQAGQVTEAAAAAAAAAAARPEGSKGGFWSRRGGKSVRRSETAGALRDRQSHGVFEVSQFPVSHDAVRPARRQSVGAVVSLEDTGAAVKLRETQFWKQARLKNLKESSGPSDGELPGAVAVLPKFVPRAPSKDSNKEPTTAGGGMHAAAVKKALSFQVEQVRKPPRRIHSASSGDNTDGDASCSDIHEGEEDDCSDSASEEEEEHQEKTFEMQERLKRKKSLAQDSRNTVDDLSGLALEDRPFLARFATSVQFEELSGLILFSNALLLGIQVELQQQDAGKTATAVRTFQGLNLAFSILFTIELALRAYAASPMRFWIGSEWPWAWFDTIVVAMQWLEVFISLAAGQSDNFGDFSTIGRLLRIARIMRVIRIFSAIRWCRPLRILISAIFVTLKSVGWTLLLLAMIMYVFAIIFTVNVRDYLDSAHTPGTESSLRLQQYFGSVPRSASTLFKTIFGGIDWEIAMQPLSDTGWVLVLLFLAYVSFVNLAVMNVVAGLFLSSAIEQAQSDEEHVIAMRLREKHKLEDRLRKLFSRFSTKSSDSLSLREFERNLEDEHMQAFLDSFDIASSDAWTLFKLLDTDGGGSVDLNEFVEGCIRLKGSAKSIQVAELGYHDKWIMDKLIDLSEYVRDNFEVISHKIEMSSKLHAVSGPAEGRRKTRMSTFSGATRSAPVQDS